jgi:hypothetical protein
VAALLAHPALRGTGVRQARVVFDGLLVATSLLFLSWTFVLGPLWQSTDLTTAGGLVALGYPFGDVVIVLFVVLAVRGMTREGRLPLWLLLGGLLAMALADSTYAYLVETGRNVTGHLIDSGWVVGYLGGPLPATGARALRAQRAGAARRPAGFRPVDDGGRPGSARAGSPSVARHRPDRPQGRPAWQPRRVAAISSRRRGTGSCGRILAIAVAGAGETVSGPRRTGRRTSTTRDQGLYVWIVGSVVLATTVLSLFDTYLLLTLMAE